LLICRLLRLKFFVFSKGLINISFSLKFRLNFSFLINIGFFMAGTIFIDFGTVIKGSSADKKFPGKIILNSYSFGASKPLKDPSNTNRTNGPSTLGVITCTKELDLASSSLYQFCLLGTEIAKVTLSYGDVNTKGEFKEKVIYELGKVYVASVSTSGSGSIPSETFSLDFISMECTYKQQGSDGAEIGVSGWTFDRSNGTATITK